MGPAFDPYHKWLGIPREHQPPDYYRLLAIEPFESDLDVIQAAADQRMAHLRNYQTGAHSALSQQLLNEVASARVCLLNVAKKAAYDEQLRAKLHGALEAAQEEYPLETPVPPVVNVLDGLPYSLPPRVSARKKSVGFGSHLPFPAVIAGASVVGVLLMAVMYWNGNFGSLTTSSAAVKPRIASSTGTAKVARQGDNAAGENANRTDQRLDKKGPSAASEPSSSIAKPTEAAPPSPIESPQATPSATPDTDAKLPNATEGSLPSPSEPSLPPPSSESPDKTAATPPTSESVPPASSSAAEQKAAERTSAAPTRMRFRFNRWFDLLSSRNELTDWEVHDGHYHYADRIIELDDGYLFCPIVAKDAMIQATVKRSGSGSHVYLLLRNSEEGCYAAGLEDRFVRIYRVKQFAGADRKLPHPQHRTYESLGEFSLPQGNANAATVVFVLGFSAVGDTLAVYINTDIPLLTVKDNHFSEGTVGIGVRNNARAYFTNVELKIPNKAAFVADLRPMPNASKGGESKGPAAK
jgi:hypothetical protein